jgi:hypothetical protein
MGAASDIVIDLNGEVVTFSRADVTELAALAAADAGTNSARRDLSLILSRALDSSGRVALRRGELDVLRQLVAEHGLTERLPQLPA